ncbi:G2/M phase-specific E3 ubiquitin-protein ligase [Oryzias melastigma]|uniref:HECT-type E3 ubiquitin transferase n=1 Tax=Oryzias melastigma TaxID=30732 RepID=A0A834CC70_ORYME|nr:G2/M phase-specific E3 ubiquitin-protein ligase [Oryzias melastigma]
MFSILNVNYHHVFVIRKKRFISLTWHMLPFHLRLRLFRNTATPTTTPRRRERTRLATFRVVLLLEPNLQAYHPHKAEAMKKIHVPLSLNEAEFRDALISMFPRLRHRDFDMVKVDAHRRISKLLCSPLSPSMIKTSRELNRSALYLLPKEDLEGPAENVNDGDTLAHPAQTPNTDHANRNPGRDLFTVMEEPPMSSESQEVLNDIPETFIGDLLENSDDISDCYETNLVSLLEQLRSQVSLETPPSSNLLNICRTDVLDGALRAFQRTRFSPYGRLSVVFMDEMSQAEGAVDEGGPTREFFRLLMIKIRDSMLFSGPEEEKYLNLDSDALQRGLYRTFGVMIAVAIVHGGVMPGFFSQRLYDNLCERETPAPTLGDISDPELQKKLRKISEAQHVEEARDAINEAAESLSLLGSYRYITTLDGRDQLVQAATTFYVEGRTKEALQQFADGLRTLGLLREIRTHPMLFTEVLMKRDKHLTATDMMELFEPSLSTVGSNRWRDEKRTEGYWRDYLIDVEDGAFNITLEDILVFASGADRIPVLGFNPKPTLEFLSDPTRRFPEANTCLVQIRLPVLPTYRAFAEKMCDGIIQSPTFGVA